MKNVFRKNQVIITALAMMIAVAGYLNYSGTRVDTNELASEVSGEIQASDLADISDEDILAQEEAALAGDEDIESVDVDLDAEADDDTEAAESEETSGETPGEAVLTSTDSQSIVSQAKLSREQTRAKSKESLLEIINNETLTDEQKQSAIDSMVELTDIAERETAAETLLNAKGFTDVVVNITGETADVVVNLTEIDDAERAQIEDIMKRKTGVSAENIVITPVSESK